MLSKTHRIGIIVCIAMLSHAELKAHSCYCGMILGLQGTTIQTPPQNKTQTEHAATRANLTFIGAYFLHLTHELQLVTNPDNYDQRPAKVYNFGVGVGILHYFAIQYMTSVHWRFSFNIPFHFANAFHGKHEKDPWYYHIGFLISYDLPAAAISEPRLNFGVSMSGVTD